MIISPIAYGRIASALSALSRDGSKRFFENALAELCNELPLKAASLYTYVSGNTTLTLRAQHGLSYAAYSSYSLSTESTAGRALNTRKPLLVKDVSIEQDYRDQKLISEFVLKGVLIQALPQCYSANTTCDPTKVLGVLCLYPEDEADHPWLIDFVEGFARVISEAYASAISHDKLCVRQHALIQAVSSNDLNSFLHKIGQILKNDWHYEASSFFILDDRAEVLRLRATTGLRNKSLRKDINFYNLTDSASTTIRCLLTGKEIVHYDDEAFRHNGKIDEQVIYPVKGRIFIPVFSPSSISGGDARPIGVIRVVNKLVTLGGKTEPLGFGDDDIELLRFLSSVIGVIGSLFNRVVRASEDLERALHGVQNNLFGVHSRLLQLVERTKVIDQLEAPFKHAIPDAVDHLSGLTWQLERFVSGHRTYEHQKTLLLGDVLLLLPNIFPVLMKCFNRPSQGTPLPMLKEVFEHVPPVHADPQALLLVFRNLLENSVKYCHPRNPLEISMSWSIAEDSQHLIVTYSDNGIGIEEHDAPYIFNEGYKSESAMRRCTLGAGLGLAQCAEVMRGLRGSIRLTSKREPTTFEIKIPLWEEKA